MQYLLLLLTLFLPACTPQLVHVPVPVAQSAPTTAVKAAPVAAPQPEPYLGMSTTEAVQHFGTPQDVEAHAGDEMYWRYDVPDPEVAYVLCKFLHGRLVSITPITHVFLAKWKAQQAAPSRKYHY